MMTGTLRIHDFVGKLSQPSVVDDVRRYLIGASSKQSITSAFIGDRTVAQGPLSINLDLTVACNHACPHCIDGSSLNSGARIPFDEVVASLTTLRMVGLRSVIFIGGGEPTLYSEFERVVQTAAELGLRIGIVSNGSRPGCLSGAAQYLSRGDWIRFSLDAGSDEIFQLAHQPRTPITLHAICEGPRAIKNVNKLVSCGFSFVVIAPEMLRFDPQLTVNYHEIALATRLAKNSDFDYISFKPFLARDMEGKEVLPSRLPNGAHAKKSTSNGPASDDQHFIDFDRLLADPIGKDEILPACSAAIAGDGGGLTNESILRIREGIKEAETLADDHFRVVPSLNLLALFDPEGLASARSQPRRCHMQALRQVVTPTGIYGCPGYRGDRRSLIAARDGYLNVVKYLETVAMTGAQIDRFDASTECRNITCLYSDTNWWLEHLDVDGPIPESFDHADDEIPIFL